MHRGMVRYYRKFHREQYPLPLSWLVSAAVWLRFAALAVATLLRGGFRRVRGR
jgi:hypothetical protein